MPLSATLISDSVVRTPLSISRFVTISVAKAWDASRPPMAAARIPVRNFMEISLRDAIAGAAAKSSGPDVVGTLAGATCGGDRPPFRFVEASPRSQGIPFALGPITPGLPMSRGFLYILPATGPEDL